MTATENLEAAVLGAVIDAAALGDTQAFAQVSDLPVEAFTVPEYAVIWADMLEHRGQVSLPALVSRHPAYDGVLRDLASGDTGPRASTAVAANAPMTR